MKPVRDEDLILYLFGEPDVRPDLEAALAASPELARRLAEIRATLESVERPAPPHRGDDYGARVWSRLAPRIAAERPRKQGRFTGRWRAPRRWQRWWTRWREAVGGGASFWPRWALATASAAILVALGFAAGRISRPPEDRPELVFGAAERERILTHQLAAHLAGSERLLAELVNASASEPFDAAAEREWAESLLATNRLYRRAAAAAGQRRVVALLDELEPILVDLSHAPDEPDSEEVDWLRRRVDDNGTLFKLRILEARLESRRSGARGGASAL